MLEDSGHAVSGKGDSLRGVCLLLYRVACLEQRDELGRQGQWWCTGTHTAQGNRLCLSLPNSMVNGIRLVAGNQPWWEYSYHAGRQTASRCCIFCSEGRLLNINQHHTGGRFKSWLAHCDDGHGKLI